VSRVPHCRAALDGKGAAGERLWDSRECPGPTTEAELSRPSPRRALTAGAIALAVIAPAIESAEHAVEAAGPAPTPAHAAALTPGFEVEAAFAARPSAQTRSSRSAVRLPAAVRPAVRVAHRVARTPRRVVRRTAVVRRLPRLVVHRAHRRPVLVRRALPVPVRGGMNAVLAFARTQVGARYVTGGEGPNGYDCSGFTKQAYAHAGLRLPHSSGAQAARAHAISRSQARPGDLVVGAGHVGVYMGGGMMIDAGNHHTGVVYRKLYGGLRIERF
jgi:peptidoglycan DL-endopeptidase CwlO